ncbi:NUDIX domain-containing protein, partial [Candidatus Woesearchaeota archaeon]|nr:NUDIX domain-containing protein [Candidatus Woesearchaeota archaeon]
MYRKVALIIFYDKNGRILLQNRQGISKYGEEWGYFGGGIEADETPEEAVIRETEEELEFVLKKYQFIGVVTTEDQRGTIERHVFISLLPDINKLHQKEGRHMQLF